MTHLAKPARLLFPGLSAKIYARILEGQVPKKKVVRQVVRRIEDFQSAATKIMPGWDR